MSNTTQDIAMSLFSLVKYSNGEFKSEAQKKFIQGILERYGNKYFFVSNKTHSFGASKSSNHTISYDFSLDETGVTKVMKQSLGGRRTEVWWEKNEKSQKQTQQNIADRESGKLNKRFYEIVEAEKKRLAAEYEKGVEELSKKMQSLVPPILASAFSAGNLHKSISNEFHTPSTSEQIAAYKQVADDETNKDNGIYKAQLMLIDFVRSDFFNKTFRHQYTPIQFYGEGENQDILPQFRTNDGIRQYLEKYNAEHQNETLMQENTSKRKYLVNASQLKIIQENVMKEAPIDVAKGDQIQVMSPIENFQLPAGSVGTVKHVDAIGTIRAEFMVKGRPIIVPLNPEVDRLVKPGQQPLQEGVGGEKHFIWRDKSGRGEKPVKLTKTQILARYAPDELEVTDWNGTELRDFLDDAYIGSKWESRVESYECVKII
jgi:hypothetical protein